MIVKDLKVPVSASEEDLLRAIRKALRNKNEKIRSVRILKRSIDARKKPDVSYVMTLAVNESPVMPKLHFPKEIGKPSLPVAVVGMGPAGLFAADALLSAGFSVLLLERGADVDTRTKDVETFWETGKLDPESNVQFGEGGAGTFSDGKLNTRTKDTDGLKDYVLRRFFECGAKEEVLYDAKAHVGTDALKEIVRNFRNELLRAGADIRFRTKLTDIGTEDGRVTSVTVNESEIIPVSGVILAIGHSARDTYEMLLKCGIPMEKKAFAAGVRMEHLQKDITLNQYGTLDYEELGAAPYAVTAKGPGGRGVFSFCMCPGGYVVNASSEEGKLCVNGMSYEDRASDNANAGIVMQIFPKDWEPFSDDPESVLSGIDFQRMLEKAAFDEGGGAIPVQRYGDFLSGKQTEEFGRILPVMKGSFRKADLNRVLPAFMADALKAAVPQFGRMIPGFDSQDALLSAVESRTSSPVRIVRDECCESSVRGLYPCGEGAGYAGGIVSAAMDGLKCALALIENAAKETETEGKKNGSETDCKDQ